MLGDAVGGFVPSQTGCSFPGCRCARSSCEGLHLDLFSLQASCRVPRSTFRAMNFHQTCHCHLYRRGNTPTLAGHTTAVRVFPTLDDANERRMTAPRRLRVRLINLHSYRYGQVRVEQSVKEHGWLNEHRNRLDKTGSSRMLHSPEKYSGTVAVNIVRSRIGTTHEDSQAPCLGS